MDKRKTAKTAPPPRSKATTEQVLAAVQSSGAQVRTKSVDFSFNELFDMYCNDELRIDPEYQRLFRWEQEKRSRFIESLVLELPTPPIYVVEEEGGRYELIDGLQRFSTYLHLRGRLKDREGNLVAPLVLDGCDIVDELNGLTYDEIPTALQIRLKRTSVPVQILRKESDRRLRYHMFKRLNTGGEPLSEQEIRNATIRLLGTQFNDLLQTLAKDGHFRKCTDIMTEEAKGQMTREECVLRFFAFKNDFGNYTKLIKPFLDKYMERQSDGPEALRFNYENEIAIFRHTFELFASSTGERSFSTVTKSGTLGNQFSVAHYDMLTQGVQTQLGELREAASRKSQALSTAIIALKKDATFREGTTGGGKNYASAYRSSIGYVESWFKKWLATG